MPHSLETVEKIKRKHGLSGDAAPLAFSGDVNEPWSIGDEFILRINRREECDDEAAREALVVPLVRAAGIRTPELIACSYEADIVPRPYTIYRRAPGVLLGNLDIDPSTLAHLYREIGRELALLHQMEVPKELTNAHAPWGFKPTEQIQKAREAEKFTDEEVQDMHAWMNEISRAMGEPNLESLIHKDIHPWNLMVDPNTFELTSILDWGDSMSGDVASDFASMPLIAVPHMLQGYAEAGEKVDDSLIAKALYNGLGLAAWELRCGTPETYRRQWWRMPVGGWQETKQFVSANFPEILHSVP